MRTTAQLFKFQLAFNEGKQTSLKPSLYKLCSLSGTEGYIRDHASAPTLKESRAEYQVVNQFIPIILVR